MKRKLICLCLCTSLLFGTQAQAGLTKTQKRTADRIAKITAKNYGKYGILPSVATGQALTESSLGKHCIRSYNLWGLKQWGKDTYAGFNTLEEGVKRYLEVLSKDRYRAARFKRDYETQLRHIVAGGYIDDDSYVSYTVRGIKMYGFERYDRKMFRKIKAGKVKARRIRQKKSMKKKQGHVFKVVYDSSVPGNEAWVSKGVAESKGTVRLKRGDDSYRIFDVKAKEATGYTMRVSDKRYEGWEVKLEFCEGACG